MADSAKEIIKREMEKLDDDILVYQREIQGLRDRIASHTDLIDISKQARDALNNALTALVAEEL